MKKVLFIPLTVLVSSLVVSYVSSNKTYQSLKADEMVTHIEMNADAFVDYAEEKGSFANADATFWGENYSFNALEPFFRGETAEGWTGSLTLKSWKQYTQFIRFQWGGAKNVEDQIKLEIHYGEYSYSMFNDTFTENPMMMDYFKIPDEQFALLDKTNGFDMYITLVDNRTNDYGFHNFGALYVNQNEDEVSGAMRYYLNHINLSDNSEWKVNNNRLIYSFYLNNPRLKEVFLKTASNVDEDFENIGQFLNNWYIDLNYGNTPNDVRHVDNLLSNRAVREESNMQFNKTGASFFSGWYEATFNQGYIASDFPRYRFVSRPFVLDGTGLVSIKMAGRSASLHVIDAETQQDLAWADVRTFSTAGDENRQYTGFNTVTMVRHYINLSAYLNKTIQLAIADVYEDNWAASYFDELITHYETYPTFDIDVLFQDNNEDKTYNYHFDQYISSTHIDNDPCGLKYVASKEEVTEIDESPINKAAMFLRSYYATLRSPSNEFSYEKASQEARQEIYNKYIALDDEAKEIVDNSSDLRFTQPFDNEWYKKAVSVGNKISASIGALLDEFQTFNVTFNANGGTGTMDALEKKGEYPLPQNGFTAPEGKEFAGWKVNNTGDLLAPGATINVTEDIEIFAQWKEKEVIKYTVTFNANGGTGNMNDIEVVEGQQLTLPACTFIAPEGKEFDCWIIRNNLYQVGDKVDINVDIEVFAKWKNIKVVEESYVVSFNANGGSGTMNDVTDVKGDYTLPDCGFIAPEGLEFDYWLIADEKYQPGDVINVNSDIEIIACWKDKPGTNPGPDTSSSEPTSSEPSEPTSSVVPNTSENNNTEPAPKSGCGGEIVSSTILLSSMSLLVVASIIIKKRKNNDNK